MSSALEIISEAPLGSANYNNEFGRPNVCGFFRTVFLDDLKDDCNAVEINSANEDISNVKYSIGFHKPIMLAGGIGSVRREHILKKKLKAGDLLIVLGGPSMLIGLGGGSSSSLSAGINGRADLDFASVQRENAEMERRCQEVINACTQLNDLNPIISIHDVGAGGLSNALPELVNDAGKGAYISLSAIPTDDPGMNALQLWCNESQERFVLALSADEDSLEIFRAIAHRENCPFSVVGKVTDERYLIVEDDRKEISPNAAKFPINCSMDWLFDHNELVTRESKTLRSFSSHDDKLLPSNEREMYSLNLSNILEVSGVVDRLLFLPAIASKLFLITIGDRSVGGLVSRDQLVGPFQVPVSNVAVVRNSLDPGSLESAQAIGIGEKPLIAVTNPCASVRMALCEAILNLLSADVDNFSEIVVSANWMAAVKHLGQDKALANAVSALVEACKACGIVIPVGKDSLSMETTWKASNESGQEFKKVVSPVTCVITAFANCNVQGTITPQLLPANPNSKSRNCMLVLVPLTPTSRSDNAVKRMGGSCLAQVFQKEHPHLMTSPCPDYDFNTKDFGILQFYQGFRRLRHEGLILAYHDVSDGGLFVTVMEMAFAGRIGVHLRIPDFEDDLITFLFNEEAAIVIQIDEKDFPKISQALPTAIAIGETESLSLEKTIKITSSLSAAVIYEEKISSLYDKWNQVGLRVRKNRGDDPKCVENEIANHFEWEGLYFHIPNFKPLNISGSSLKPRVCILREQGVNGHREMALAFHLAGFTCVDVHLNDLIEGRISSLVENFDGLVACGGFSFGDVFGAGTGWAVKILHNERLCLMFKEFFEASNTFTFGVCNGCQMLCQLKELIPGTERWPDSFISNDSGRFEARLSQVKITPSKSIFFQGMQGWSLPIIVSHGEGKVYHKNANCSNMATTTKSCMSYCDDKGIETERYPFNPNGSISGQTGFASEDGRATILMPHPERLIYWKQFSWSPATLAVGKSPFSPWFQMFTNAFQWTTQNSNQSQ